MESSRKNYFPWHILILMASVTFMAIVSELLPSGLLPEIAEGFNVSEAQAGGFVGQYALASAIFAIPIISLTMRWDRKRLLMILLIGFSVANLIVGFVSTYWVGIIARVIGGLCAGALWSMISDYGMKLVSPEEHGKAVAVIMAGTTIGMSLGLPFTTWIGHNFGFHFSFVFMGAFAILMAVLSYFILPHVSGEEPSKSNSPFTLLKNKGVMVIILLTLLVTVSNYGVYTYITNLVRNINYSGIGLAQLLFGIGSILSVIIAGYFIDNHLKETSLTMFLSSGVAMLLFYFSQTSFLHHIGFVLWGIGFGALVTLFQTAVTKQVSEGKAVATSLQSSAFNFSIMIGSTSSGWLLTNISFPSVLLFAIILLVISVIVSMFANETLK